MNSDDSESASKEKNRRKIQQFAQLGEIPEIISE